MNILQLKDAKPTPDIIHLYSKHLRESSVPIVIDNGSYQCRVGWANQKDPLLVFKNLIAKPRKERGKKDGETVTQVGNDITNIEAVRFQLKTQFDRNVVTHFEAQEQVFDYMFSHLGINTEGKVNHPIVITEAYLNPNYCRQLMSELLFECYRVPSVSYGVDALFSFQYNNPKCKNSLIINCGQHTTHVIPVVNGVVDHSQSRRINMGGFNIVNYLHRLLQLKYPSHFNAITPSRIEELVHRQSFFAVDYQAELQLWTDSDHYDNNVCRLQLPYAVPIITPGLTPEQQKERRKELARRLTEINARKREERLAEDEEQLNQLYAAQDLLEEGEEEEYQKVLDTYELSDMSDLQKLITTLQQRIERTKQKIVAVNTAEDSISEEPKLKILKEAFRPKDQEDFIAWISNVKQKRQVILDRRAARRQRRQDMAKRRTAAAQERMRLISQLARKDKRGDDNFGMRDEDWDVYKAINKEGGDSESDEDAKLLELEEVLRRHDPHFDGAGSSEAPTSTAENHQLHVGVEQLRAPEILFQPSMVGSMEAGLAEVIEFILARYPAHVQTLLVSKVFLTGSCARMPGLAERLNKELMEMRPFKSKFSVTVSKDPSLDAWHGARSFAASPNLNLSLVTKQEYDEFGGEFFKEHFASNVYQPSPTPLPAVEVVPPMGLGVEEVEIEAS